MRRPPLALTLLLALIPGWTLTAQAQSTAKKKRCDYLVVVPPGDAALKAAIAPLAKHRSDEGLRVAVRESGSAGDTATTVALVRALKPRFLLLVGDVDKIPTFDVRKAATDRPYGDLDGDGYPEVSIGRFPSNDPVVIKRLVARTIAYETTRSGGAWRKQCALVAGEARFAPALDKLIEGVFTRLVADSLPAAYDVDLTYANPNSPYCYPPHRFARRVVKRLNEGALVLAYVGHGQVRSLDDLRIPIKGRKRPLRFPVLNVGHAKRVNVKAAPPIVVVLACWTGRYEGPKRCIGEVLLAKEGGPIAFFGSSRISHPVPNAVLGKELIRELFQGPSRLGPALDRARKAMVVGRWNEKTRQMRDMINLSKLILGRKMMEREFRRHVDMYNLLGDPALRLARPEGRIELASKREGRLLRVSGKVPFAVESVTVTLEVPRDKVARKAAEGETPYERYARHNDKVVRAEHQRPNSDGSFTTTIKLPQGLAAGTYYLKAFGEAKRRCAIGAKQVTIRTP